MAQAHTPGDWETCTLTVWRAGVQIVRQGVVRVGQPEEEERLICLMFQGPGEGGERDKLEREANARLIAAAPRMLAALELALAQLKRPTPGALANDLCAIRSVLARAKGE